MKFDKDLLKKTFDYQYRRGISYQRTDGPMYKAVRTFQIVSFVYLMAFQLILLLALWLVPNDNPAHYLQNTLIAFILFAISFVFMFLKLNLVALLINGLGFAFKISPLIPLLIINSGAVDIKPAFYWQHLFPMVLTLIGGIWLTIIALRERFIIKRDYKIVSEKNYKENFEILSE